jgi:imidazolonepropionase-like amidohydrolase
LLVGVLLLASVADARSAPSAPPARSATVVLRAARMLDVVRGKIVEDALVVVEDERILSVNPSTPPSGARTIDLGDMTLLPGLIDAHTHLTYDVADGWITQVVVESPADLALRGARNARLTLEAGFTTVRDVGAYDFADVALARAVDRGFVAGPRIVPSGYMLGITGGHCDVTGFIPGVAEHGPLEGIADGADEVLKAVRYQIKHGARVIKTCATAGIMSFEASGGAQQYTEAELRVMVEEATRHEIPVAAHAHGTEGILAAVRAGVASIEHGSILNDEAIVLMKRKGTFLVPTLYTWRAPGDYPPLIVKKTAEMKPHVDQSVRAAIRAGVKIAFGTDSGTFPHGENAKEFAILVELGMSPLEAVRTATLRAAELLGIEDRDVRFVMFGGRIVHREPIE